MEEGGRRTGCGGEDDEAGPVVFDEFAHCCLGVALQWDGLWRGFVCDRTDRQVDEREREKKQQQ